MRDATGAVGRVCRSAAAACVAAALSACTSSGGGGDAGPDARPVDAGDAAASDAAASDAAASDADAATSDAADAAASEAGADEAAGMDAVADDTGGAMDAGGADGAGDGGSAGDAVDPADDGGSASDAAEAGSPASVCTSSPDLPVSTGDGEALQASLAWAGGEFGAAWQDASDGNPEIYFARLAPDGSALGPELRVTTSDATDAHPSLAWDGARYWVAWSEEAGAAPGGSVRLAALTPASDGGATAGAAQVLDTGGAAGGAQPVVVAVPSGGLGVAWDDQRWGVDNAEIYFAQVDAAGHRVGADVRVTSASGLSYYPLLAWNRAAGEFGLLFLDDRDDPGSEEIYFARLLATGARPAGAADVRVTDDGGQRSLWPSLAYDGTGYGVLWANENTVPDRPHIFFTQLTAAGAHRAGATDQLVSSNPPDVGAWSTALAWDGARYLLVWEDQRHPNGDLVLRRMSAAGVPETPEVFLADDTSFSAHPSAAWTGSALGVAWEDDRGDHRAVYFRRVGPTECTGE